MKIRTTVYRQLIFLLLISSSVGAQAQLTNYDNFTGKYLNPNKWDFTTSRNVYDSIKRIENRRWLRNRLVTSGDLDRTGGSRTGRHSLFLPSSRAATVRSMEMTAIVDKSRVVGCPLQNSADARTRARVMNNWFNDGDNANVGSGDAGKVFSFIELRHSSFDSSRILVKAWVFSCDDENCSTSTDLPPSNFDNTLGEVKLGQAIRYGQSWDESNSRINYWAKIPGKSLVKRSLDYSPILSNPIPTPDFDFRHQVSFRTQGAHCDRRAGTGIKRSYAALDGRILRVRLSDAVTDG